MYDLHPDISLDQVETQDTTYRISSSHDLDQLAASMGEIGLINPPVLIHLKNKYRVISGFGRIQAARQLDWKKTPARVLPENTAAQQCIQIAIVDNTANRKLNVLEQARALALLTSVTSKERLIPMAAKLGMTLNPALIEKLIIVNQMAEYLHQGLVLGAIALPVAIRLHQWPDPDGAQPIGKLLIALNTSLNRQREIVDWFEAILAREKINARQGIASLGIKTVLQDPNFDRRQKIDYVRTALRKRRYPTIAVAEKRYKALSAKLALPRGCRLIPPPHFEGNAFTLQVAFRTPFELVKVLEKLDELAQDRGLIDILDPIDCIPPSE